MQPQNKAAQNIPADADRQLLELQSIFNQPANRFFDDGSKVAMGSRLFRSGGLLSDRVQAVAFVKADA
jgi:hypothetical protein